MKKFGLFIATFMLGYLSMGFQLVASRLLAPHFGSSIIVWAFLISTFLLAFSLGSFLGGIISKLTIGRKAISLWVITFWASCGFAFTAFLGKPFLRLIENNYLSSSIGLLIACLGLFLLPVIALSSYSPIITDVIARMGNGAGFASGLIYGVSTFGNIAGVMGTAFILIPNYRISHLLILWFCISIVVLILLSREIINLSRHRMLQVI